VSSIQREKREDADDETASRLCLDLLNEELKAQIEAHQEGFIS
jgi:hypothetical protein